MCKVHMDCLSCSHSYSDDDDNGDHILRCEIKEFDVVDEFDICEEWI